MNLRRLSLLAVTAAVGLTLSSTAFSQDGPGFAADFDGVSGNMTVPSISGLAAGNTPHTIEAWVLISSLPPAGARDWLLVLGVDGAAHHWIVRSDGSLLMGMWGGVQVAPPLPLGVWTHVAATFDGSILQSYTNGLPALANPGSFNLQGIPLTIAQPHDGSLGTNEQYFNGQLDEVRIWAASRSQAQIQSSMSTLLAGSELGLIAYWQFSPSDNQTFTPADLSGHGNNATLLVGASTVLSSVPFAPDVLTAPALVTSGTNVLLNGSVNPANLPTTGYFQWGADTSYGNVTPGASLSATNAALSLTTEVDSLAPFTTYHFRVVATNAAGMAVGDDQSFTTQGGPPAVATLPASPVSYTNATLNGTVDPNFSPTLAWFQFGTNSSYGRNTAVTNLGALSGGLPVSMIVTGLVAGATYHFRMVATNAAYGRVEASEQTFTPVLGRIATSLPGYFNGSLAWGDYDNDGRLDILVTGLTNVPSTKRVTQLWRNTGNGFTNIRPGLPGVFNSAAAWGDYDNDGLLDILLTGATNTAGSGTIAQLWRNTAGGFVLVPVPGLPGVASGSVAWGDYNNDGRLDILLAGSSSKGPITQVWRNTGAGFTNLAIAGLPGVFNGGAVWGDYDNDGRLDILVTGDSNTNLVSQVWRNTGLGFSNINAGLPGLHYSAAAWADYDNDGRLDFLLTGMDTDGNLLAQLWHNTGAGFTNVPVSGLPGVFAGSVAWGDYDNDGLLDILLTGATSSDGSGTIVQVWRNTGAGFENLNLALPGLSSGAAIWGDSNNDGRLDILLAGSGLTQLWRSHHPVTNTPPPAPGSLAITSTPPTISLSWKAPSDGQTSSNGLTYNLRLGTGPLGGQVFNASADSTNGFRRLAQPGNLGHRLTLALPTNLPPTLYYWSVQAVDGTLAGGAFAPESTISLGGASRITNVAHLTNGSMRLDILGTPGRVYHGLVASNPGLPSTNWTVLGPATEISPGFFQVLDSAPPGQPFRFYKVRSP